MIENVEKVADGRYKITYKSGAVRFYKNLPKSALKFVEVQKNDSSEYDEKRQKKEDTSIEVGKSPTKAEHKYKKRCSRGRVVACIFYPDNAEHMDLMRYLISLHKCIYISHSPEKVLGLPFSEFTDELPEVNHDFKEHFHFMILFDNPVTIQGFLKSSAGVLKHAELVSDRMSYFRYMLHDTYASLKAHKKQYDISDVKTTDNDFLSSCVVSSNSPESSISCMAQITDIIDNNTIVSLPELIQLLKKMERLDLLKFALDKSYFVGNYIRENRLLYCK